MFDKNAVAVVFYSMSKSIKTKQTPMRTNAIVLSKNELFFEEPDKLFFNISFKIQTVQLFDIV